MSDPKAFGEHLRYLVFRSGLTVADFARQLGVHPTAPQKWFSGQSFPARNKHAAIAKTLGVTVDELLTMTAPATDQDQRPESDLHMPTNEILELLLTLTTQVHKITDRLDHLEKAVSSIHPRQGSRKKA